MAITHLLQDFDKFHGSGTETVITDATLEEHQLEAFEQGYKAGWDDSASAHFEDNARHKADLAASLQQYSFTFHDAQAQLLKSLRPLFQQISETLLPEIARASLPQLVAEQLAQLAADQLGDHMTLKCSGADRANLESALSEFGDYAIRIEATPDMKPGEVEISTDHEEQRIDLTHVLTGISEALEAFTHEAERKRKHA